jgi:hypothetical protein
MCLLADVYSGSSSPAAGMDSLLLRRAACDGLTSFLGWESALGGGGGAHALGRRMFVTLAADTARNLRAFAAAAAADANPNNPNNPAPPRAASWDLAPGVPDAMDTVLRLHVSPSDLRQVVDVLDDNELPSLLLAALRRLAAVRHDARWGCTSCMQFTYT